MRLLSVLVLAAAAAALAGCGSKSSAPSSASVDWANGVCSAVATWRSSITSIADGLKAGNVSEESIKSAGADAKQATQKLADDLKGLGPPKTDGGQKAQDSLNQLADELGSETKTIESSLENASGVTGALTAVSTVSATLVTMSNQVSSTFEDLRNLDTKNELQKAFEQAGSCQQLKKSASS